MTRRVAALVTALGVSVGLGMGIVVPGASCLLGVDYDKVASLPDAGSDGMAGAAGSGGAAGAAGSGGMAGGTGSGGAAGAAGSHGTAGGG